MPFVRRHALRIYILLCLLLKPTEFASCFFCAGTRVRAACRRRVPPSPRFCSPFFSVQGWACAAASVARVWPGVMMSFERHGAHTYLGMQALCVPCQCFV